MDTLAKDGLDQLIFLTRGDMKTERLSDDLVECIDSLQRRDGPINTDQNGDLPTPVLMCAFGAYRCKHFGIHEFHYFYCSAQDAANKHAGPSDYAYPWHGAGKQLLENAPDSGCPYMQHMAQIKQVHRT